jgi:hypothetical protein
VISMCLSLPRLMSMPYKCNIVRTMYQKTSINGHPSRFGENSEQSRKNTKLIPVSQVASLSNYQILHKVTIPRHGLGPRSKPGQSRDSRTGSDTASLSINDEISDKRANLHTYRDGCNTGRLLCPCTYQLATAMTVTAKQILPAFILSLFSNDADGTMATRPAKNASHSFRSHHVKNFASPIRLVRCCHDGSGAF